jgi:hypothetical protein
MLATIENMYEYAGAKDRNVFAYSPNTGEEYSADPHDYFDAPHGWVMKDSEDKPMILVRRSTRLIDVE